MKNHTTKLILLFVIAFTFTLGHLTGRRAVICEISGQDPYDFSGPAYILHVPSSIDVPPKEPHRTLEVYAYIVDGKRIDIAKPPEDQTEIWQIVVANNRIIVFGVEKKSAD